MKVHSNFNQSDSLHKLNTPQQVILSRLRNGHIRLNVHTYSKFKVGESEMCPCNTDITTAEHLLQHCQLHDALRKDMWQEPTPLRHKLYGKLEELRNTAAFMWAIDISVWCTMKKKMPSCRLPSLSSLQMMTASQLPSSQMSLTDIACNWLLRKKRKVLPCETVNGASAKPTQSREVRGHPPPLPSPPPKIF